MPKAGRCPALGPEQDIQAEREETGQVCIAAHAHAAVQHGATLQEAAEAIGVTFVMNGGPATVCGARAFAAFREFYDQRAAGDPRSGQRQPTGHEHEIGQPNGHQHVG